MPGTEDKPPLLVVTSTFPRWRGDREPPFVFELCRRLGDAFDVHVLAPDAPAAKRKEIMEGIKVTRFPYFIKESQSLAYEGGILPNLKRYPWRMLLVPFFLLGEFIALLRMLRSRPFALIHAHWLIPQGLLAIAALRILRLPIPLLCTAHGGDLYALKGSLFDDLRDFVIARADGLTVASRAMGKEVLARGARLEKTRVIPMGVDLKGSFIPPCSPRVAGQILFVGRLIERKGLSCLIRALPAVRSLHPEVRLLVVGAGPQEDRFRKEAEILGLGDCISFLGALENDRLPLLYGASELVVFPSVDQEGFGLVLVEALGCECAVVATDLDAVRDIVEDGKTGLVVAENDERALAERIVYLLDNGDVRAALGAEGRLQVLRKYDWTTIALAFRGFMEFLSRKKAIF